jgi:hypothetical protein
MTFDPAAVRLGKKPGVVHDRRTIAAEAILASPDEIKVLPAHRIARNLHQVPMFANDTYGDCTVASQGHRIVAMENSSGQREVQLTTGELLSAYSAITGFRADDPATDNGAYELDVLNYVRQVGLGRERDGTSHTIGAFAAVDWTDHHEFAQAHYVFGGLKVCAGLPISAQRQEVWDVTEGADARFGSWGGHSTYCVGYDRDGILLYTWGAEKRATWAWVDKYVDECYLTVSEDYFRGAKTPQGFSIDSLLYELRAINVR